MSQILIIMGYLGKDPVMQYTAQGTPVTNFNIASDEVSKDKDGNTIKRVTWFRCSAWNAAAENINKFFKKGQGIYVEGIITSGPDGNPKVYQKQDNSWAASHDVLVRNWHFVPSAKNAETGTSDSQEPPVEDLPEPPLEEQAPAEPKKTIPF